MESHEEDAYSRMNSFEEGSAENTYVQFPEFGPLSRLRFGICLDKHQEQNKILSLW